MKSIINMFLHQLKVCFSKKKENFGEDEEDQLLNLWSSASSRCSNNSIGVQIETDNG